MEKCHMSKKEQVKTEEQLQEQQEIVNEEGLEESGNDTDHEVNAGLQTQLDAANLKLESQWNEVLRARADVENIRRRSEKDVANAHRYALEKFVKELLPVIDSLERGLHDIESDHEMVDAMQQGMKMTLEMMISAVKKFGVEPLDPTGEKFNPEQHEAMSMQPSEEHESNTVMQVMQKGYLLNDRLIRPAMVMVAK